MRSIQRVITRSSNAAKRVRAFNPSRYERAFDVRLVLSGTVHIILYILLDASEGPIPDQDPKGSCLTNM